MGLVYIATMLAEKLLIAVLTSSTVHWGCRWQLMNTTSILRRQELFFWDPNDLQREALKPYFAQIQSALQIELKTNHFQLRKSYLN